MRLSPSQQQSIRAAFKKQFTSHDQLWVFGSRVNDDKHGGDIDLYIETHQEASQAVMHKMLFINDLWQMIGDQKIDVVLNVLSQAPRPIHHIAKSTGFKLV